MEVTQHDKVLILKLKGTYDMYEVKVLLPDFQILSIHKETYPDYWVVTSIDDLDYNSQDKLFQCIWKVKKEHESKS
jgi:hypothetical protein